MFGEAPIEVVAEDDFDDEVVGGGGGTPAGADVDLPLGGDEEIDDGEELLLLVMQRDEVAELAVVGVVLETDVVVLVGLEGDGGSGAEGEAAG